ncbi:hypothetical protein [Vibrio aquimaris]|uniref:Uncharacterized protein n=1 Tax=Vibrio aquimaris TaxID=2587862 RepID=A0A5P9CRH5_9VIBR|nr:hypothetical protein [Vibrio aquimaris]QFT28806.1 hypothetical protein FIV01_20605 [Vibrio aquimaris]
MAVTVRKIEEHAEMMEELKKLTGEKTAAGALIKAGYIAIRESERAQTLSQDKRELEYKLNDTQYKVSNFIDALNELKEIDSK